MKKYRLKVNTPECDAGEYFHLKPRDFEFQYDKYISERDPSIYYKINEPRASQFFELVVLDNTPTDGTETD